MRGGLYQWVLGSYKGRAVGLKREGIGLMVLIGSYMVKCYKKSVMRKKVLITAQKMDLAKAPLLSVTGIAHITMLMNSFF